MAKKISSSVGKGGKNKPADTQIVQELLNGFSKSCGFKKLDVDGLIGPKTISAIATFQTKAGGMAKADSRVDPGGQSLKTLNLGPKKAEAEAKKAEKAEKAAEAKQEEKEEAGGSAGKSQLKGDHRGLDKKLLGLLNAVSAHYGKPIDVVLGKQREASGKQRSGEDLYDHWLDDNVDRGTREPFVKQDKTLQKKLNKLFEGGDKRGFLAEYAKKAGGKGKNDASEHASGTAVDLHSNTDRKMVAALETILRRGDESGVIHFDDRGKNIPSTITESIKKKWK